MCEKVKSCMETIISYIRDTLEKLDVDQLEKIIDALLKAPRIFVVGAGRSGLVAKAFAMRLMHLGFDTYVVGETTTPAIKPNDVVVAISGSGETISTVNLGKVAKEFGSELIAITSNPSSSLGKLADIKLVVEGRERETARDFLVQHMRGEYKSMTPLGTVFEINSLVVLDGIIAELISLKGLTEEELKKRHVDL